MRSEVRVGLMSCPDIIEHERHLPRKWQVCETRALASKFGDGARKEASTAFFCPGSRQLELGRVSAENLGYRIKILKHLLALKI